MQWLAQNLFHHGMQHKYRDERDHSRVYATVVLAAAIVATVMFAHAAAGPLLDGGNEQHRFGGFTIKNTSTVYRAR